MNKLQKIAVGMSGGVDSSLAAALLLRDGYDVEGVYLECFNEPGCRTDKDREDALKTALMLGIKYAVLDYREEYRERVVNYFYDTYKRGLTPNPDVLCNREIKFGLFLEWAIEHGFDAIATGHYARIIELNGERRLQRGKDKGKDQSYFLYRLNEKQLGRVRFPIGDMEKGEVRKMARELGLPVADKPDSKGICFIGNVDVGRLLEKKLGENKGKVIYRGKVVGEHRGLWFYTKGQRGGFTLDKKKLTLMGESPEKMKPLFVIGKNILKNQIIVGYKKDTFTDYFEVAELSWINEKPKNGQYYVRIRNLGDLYECNVEIYRDLMSVKVRGEIMGVASGQSAVLYKRIDGAGDEIVVGGGVII